MKTNANGLEIRDYTLVIDADSVLYRECYKYTDRIHLEDMYADTIKGLGRIERALWDRVGYTKGDTLKTEIVLTKGTNFRYDIFSNYKIKRKEKTPLDDAVIKVRNMLIERLSNVVCIKGIEADDYCVAVSNKRETNTYLAAIDKDVINASRVPCYNYTKGEWVEAHTEEQVEDWYMYQSMLGDSADGIIAPLSAKGVGKVGATKFMKEYQQGLKTEDDFIDLFSSKENCELTMRLIRMDQYDLTTKEVKLWDIEEWLFGATAKEVVEDGDDW